MLTAKTFKFSVIFLCLGLAVQDGFAGMPRTKIVGTDGKQVYEGVWQKINHVWLREPWKKAAVVVGIGGAIILAIGGTVWFSRRGSGAETNHQPDQSGGSNPPGETGQPGDITGPLDPTPLPKPANLQDYEVALNGIVADKSLSWEQRLERLDKVPQPAGFAAELCGPTQESAARALADEHCLPIRQSSDNYSTKLAKVDELLAAIPVQEQPKVIHNCFTDQIMANAEQVVGEGLKFYVDAVFEDNSRPKQHPLAEILAMVPERLVNHTSPRAACIRETKDAAITDFFANMCQRAAISAQLTKYHHTDINDAVNSLPGDDQPKFRDFCTQKLKELEIQHPTEQGLIQCALNAMSPG